MSGQLTFCIFWSCLFQGLYGATFDDLYRLKYDLFQAANYSNMVRPKLNQSEVTEIHLKMFLGMLIEMDTREQVMKTSGWFYITWIDEKLRWNPDDYGGIEEMNVLQKDIWLPDFIATNSVQGHEFFGGDKIRIYINSTGRVVWEPAFTFATACNMDVTMFPVDKQNCTISIIPWMTTSKHIRIKTLGMDLNKLLSPNYQFDIVNATSQLNENKFNGNPATVLQGILFEIHLKRRAFFYQLNVIGPIASISFLCGVSFLVQPESGEKLTVSITVLLSVTVFFGVVDEYLPKTSRSTSYFVIYVTTLMVMSFLGVVINAIIMYLYNLKPNTKMPAIFQIFIEKKDRTTHQCAATVEENIADSKDTLDFTAKIQKNHWHILTRKLDMLFLVIFMVLLSLANVALALLLQIGIVGLNPFGSDIIRAYVNYSGVIDWEPDFTLTTGCKIDVTMFPVDVQKCTINIIPWMTTDREIKITASNIDVSMIIAENGQFDILDTNITEEYAPISGNPTQLLHINKFQLYLKRKATFYIMNVVGPISVISFLCGTSFLVPAESGEKLTVAITVLLSLTVFLGAISELLPKTSETTSYFVIFVTLMIGMSFLGVVGNVITLYVYNLPQNTRIPACLKTLLLKQKRSKVMDIKGSLRRNSVAIVNVKQQVCEICYHANLDHKITNCNHWPEIARLLDKFLFVTFMIFLLSFNFGFAFLYI